MQVQALGQGCVEGQEGRREDCRKDPPTPCGPDLVFEEGWITGLLGFWDTNIALCAGVTFAKVRGAVSVLAKRTLCLCSLAAAMSHSIESLQVSLSSQQH